MRLVNYAEHLCRKFEIPNCIFLMNRIPDFVKLDSKRRIFVGIISCRDLIFKP